MNDILVSLPLDGFIKNHLQTASTLYGEDFQSNPDYNNSKYKEMYLIQLEQLIKQN